MLKPIQRTILKILEEELITFLALLIAATGIFFAKAQSDISVHLTVYPVGGSITITAPNGGETWTVNTSATITWTTLGPIDDVKIELQRATGGAWEELTSSTTNDGSYSWPVTTPATSQALIKISKVGDDTVNDTSNAVFTIQSSDGGGGGGGGGGGSGTYEPAKPPPEEIKPPVQPRFILTDYSPKIMVHNRPNKLFLYGKNPEDLIVRLSNQSMTYTTASYRTVTTAGESAPVILEYLIPAFSLPKGLIDWRITSSRDNTIIADNLSIYVIDALPSQELKAKATVLNPGTIKLLSQTEGKIKVRFTNTGTLEWNNFLQPLHIGTSRPRDRKSKFIDPSWPYSNRTVRAVLLKTIKPGESFDAEFTVQAPILKRSTRFNEYFALVADGLTWIQGSEFKISILVKPQKASITAKNPPSSPVVQSYQKPPNNLLDQAKSSLEQIKTYNPSTGGITQPQPQQLKTPSPYQQTKIPRPSLVELLKNALQKIKLFLKF